MSQCVSVTCVRVATGVRVYVCVSAHLSVCLSRVYVCVNVSVGENLQGACPFASPYDVFYVRVIVCIFLRVHVRSVRLCEVPVCVTFFVRAGKGERLTLVSFSSSSVSSLFCAARPSWSSLTMRMMWFQRNSRIKSNQTLAWCE